MSTTVLPLDIIYHVLEEAYPDTDTLKATSLVSKELQRCSQQLLFRHYKMDTGIHDQHPVKHDIKPIYSSPHLLQYVRSLSLQTPFLETNVGDWLCQNVNAAVEVIKLLPVDLITAFQFEGIAFQQCQGRPLNGKDEEFARLVAGLCGAPNLRSLKISHQDFRLLPLCGPSLKELAIFKVSGMRQQDIPSPTRASPMLLTTLSIADGGWTSPQATDVLEFLTGLQPSIAFNALETLMATVSHRSEGPIQKILKQSQGSITNLVLVLAFTMNLKSFGLGSCKSLRSIYIDAPFPYDDEPDILPWIYSELSTAHKSPLPLETLSVHFVVEEYELPLLDTNLWTGFVSLLASRAALPSLRSFVMKIKGRLEGRDKVLTGICKGFRPLGTPELSSISDRSGQPTVIICWSISR